jgi:hypothetical protein
MRHFRTLASRTLMAVALAAPLFVVNPAQAEDKKKDPDEIGNRDVGKGVNF